VLNNPGRQSIQEEPSVWVPYEPAAHCEQNVASLLLAKFPISHCEQYVLPVELIYLPGRHATQLSASELELFCDPIFPGGQPVVLQSMAPEPVVYHPEEQDVHIEFPMEL